jgi:uncharacterized damage-inducible protein DinB
MTPTEGVMRTTELLLKELDLEAHFTRKHLERVPMNRLDYKPHEKSMTLGWLATFTAILPSWGTLTLAKNEYDVAPPGGATEDYSIRTTTESLLALFDKNIAETREALSKMTEATLDEPWALKAAGDTIFSQPRGLVYRTFIMNHLVHHRAQLGVFLRMLGVAVPAVYNDSADEKGGMFIDVIPDRTS